MTEKAEPKDKIAPKADGAKSRDVAAEDLEQSFARVVRIATGKKFDPSDNSDVAILLKFVQQKRKKP